MVFIEAGDQEGAEHSQDRSPPPKSPMFDGHAVQGLPPTVEEAQTDNSVTNEVTGLADEMMHFVPVLRADGAKQLNPQRMKPFAGISRRHGAGRLQRNHEYAQRRG